MRDGLLAQPQADARPSRIRLPESVERRGAPALPWRRSAALRIIDGSAPADRAPGRRTWKTLMSSPESESATIRQRVEDALDRIRPALQADGGDVELLEVDAPIARVKMVGACGGCPMSMMTLKAGIEAAIVEAVPEITSVEGV